MQKFFLGFLLTICVASVAFAGGQSDQMVADFTVSMATDVGGLGDQSFNDGVYEGLQLSQDQNGVDIRIVESRQQTDYIPNLTGLAEDGSNVVFAVGFLMAEAVTEAALAHPDTYFAGVDIFVSPDEAPSNLLGILFREEESGYLAGIVAGLLTNEYSDISPRLNDANVLGVALGLLIPPVERYEVGFKAGVHKYNPDAEVISIVTGSFNDVSIGKEAALAMIDEGADIVFQVAGLTGVGVINAAKERNVFAIGVDVDQNNLDPDTVLTSAIKKLTQATYLTILSAIEGEFQGGDSRTFGINEDATGISPFGAQEDIIPDAVKDILAEEIQAMKDGRVDIPTTRAEAESMGIN